jgi:hypothetical protein
MPTFIKTGFWDKLSIAPKNYLDLDLLISSLVPPVTGFVPTSRTLTINGTNYDLTANRSWTVGDLLSSGSYTDPTWITSLAGSKISGGISGNSGTVTNGVYTVGDQTIAGDKTFTGVFKETITSNRQIASYSLLLADRGKLIEMNVASPNTLTVPLESSINFPIGSKIDVTQYGAGATTITAAVGVTIRSFSAFLKLAGQYAGCTLVKIGTNEWHCYGNLIA